MKRFALTGSAGIPLAILLLVLTASPVPGDDKEAPAASAETTTGDEEQAPEAANESDPKAVPAGKESAASKPESDAKPKATAPAPKAPAAAAAPAPMATPVDSHTPPPRPLHKVGDHWTPYQPPDPESFPEGSQIHLIVVGDTLWDMAGKHFQNPYLWPQIWNENRYIQDSHWIYPGDPLLLPPRPTVVSEIVPGSGETGIPAPAEPSEADTGGEGIPEPGDLAPAPDLSADEGGGTGPEPAADHRDLYCTGSIREDYDKTDLYIAAAEERDKVGFSTGDLIYVNGGREGGRVQPGDRMAIVAREEEVFHPVTGKFLGTYVRRLGKVKVLAVQQETSIAEIVESCQDRIEVGFELEPDREIPIPVLREHPFSRIDVEPSGKANGYVVHLQDDVVRIGTGQVAEVDLGSKDGLKPGDLLLVYLKGLPPRERQIAYKYHWNGKLYESQKLRNDDSHLPFPRRPIGQAVVLMTTERTATVKIVDAVREIELGTPVELR